jgi:hypothetical protein
LSYLRTIAGPFDRDEQALLRALDMLDASRLIRYAEHQQYADRRRQEKRAGRRTPRALDVDPASSHGYWFGAPVLAVGPATRRLAAGPNR